LNETLNKAFEMKHLLLIFLVVFSTLSFAQKAEKENIKYLKITQKKCVKKKGYQMVLKEVVNDSRCPEGVNCIWAGEVQVVVSVYQNRKFIQDKTITLSTVYNQENIDWFSGYLPSSQKKIKSIGVVPYPKDGVTVNPEDYYIKIGYLK
jgi:predicted Zn-ribbon and HTH transcriptional regulator